MAGRDDEEWPIPLNNQLCGCNWSGVQSLSLTISNHHKNRLGSLLRRVTVVPTFLQLLLRGLISFTHTSCLLAVCDSNAGSINLRLEDTSPYPGKDTTRLSPIPRSLKQIIKRRMPWPGASPRRSGSHPVHEFIPLMERLNKLIKLSGCLVQHLIHRFQSLA